MKQKKARVEDALHATRAAVEEGILPGGGVALVRCREVVEKVRGSAKGDEKIGVDIVLHALSAPMKQIADNCGIDGSVVVDEVAQKATNIGFDANAGKYVDMFKAGIIDPVKVVRSALSNAASIAGLMLTTEALVTNVRQGRQGQAARRRGASAKSGRGGQTCRQVQRGRRPQAADHRVRSGHFVRGSRRSGPFYRPRSGPRRLSFAAYSPGTESYN